MISKSGIVAGCRGFLRSRPFLRSTPFRFHVRPASFLVASFRVASFSEVYRDAQIGRVVLGSGTWGRHVPLARENRVVRSRTCRGGSDEEVPAACRKTGIKQSAVLHPKTALHTTFTGADAFSGRE